MVFRDYIAKTAFLKGLRVFNFVPGLNPEPVNLYYENRILDFSFSVPNLTMTLITLSFRRKPESSQSDPEDGYFGSIGHRWTTGCRIKSGMTEYEIWRHQ
jgi:hypothetical protein